MLKLYEELNTLEEENYTEENDILSDLEALTKIFYSNKNGDTKTEPWYCALNRIADNYDLSDKEIIDLAEKNGYKIVRIPSVGSIESFLAVADKDLDLKEIENNIRDIVKDEFEDGQVPEIKVTEIPKKESISRMMYDDSQKSKESRNKKVTIKYGSSYKDMLTCKPIKVTMRTLDDYKDYYSFVEIVNESLDEEFERVSDEECADLEKRLNDLGFDIVSKQNYGHYGDNFDEKYDIHYQIITKEGNQTEESFNEFVDKIDNLLDEFEDETGSPCTFNAGLQEDGYISCGFDARGIYYEPGEDVEHVKSMKLRYKDGKPADKKTELNLKSLSDRMGTDVSKAVPVDKADESLSEGVDSTSPMFKRGMRYFTRYPSTYAFICSFKNPKTKQTVYVAQPCKTKEECKAYINKIIKDYNSTDIEVMYASNLQDYVKALNGEDYNPSEFEETYQVRDINVGDIVATFDSYEDAQAFIDDDLGDNNYEILEEKLVSWSYTFENEEDVEEGDEYKITKCDVVTHYNLDHGKKKDKVEHDKYRVYFRRYKQLSNGGTYLDTNTWHEYGEGGYYFDSLEKARNAVSNYGKELKEESLREEDIDINNLDLYDDEDIYETDDKGFVLLPKKLKKDIRKQKQTNDDANDEVVEETDEIIYKVADMLKKDINCFDTELETLSQIEGIPAEEIKQKEPMQIAKALVEEGIIDSKMFESLKEDIEKHDELKDLIDDLEFFPDYGEGCWDEDGEYWLVGDKVPKALLDIQKKNKIKDKEVDKLLNTYLKKYNPSYVAYYRDGDKCYFDVEFEERQSDSVYWDVRRILSQIIQKKYKLDAEGDMNTEIMKDIKEDIEKHDTLNPVLFENDELKSEVKDAIQKIADTFVEEIKEDDVNLVLKDVVLVGSNVNYNYTKDSDLDIHLIVDSKALDCPQEIVDKLYGAYRTIFNKNYDINIKGIPAEIYVELDEPKGISNGVYSLNSGWIKKPVQQDVPEIDRDAFNALFNEYEDKYTELMSNENKSSEDVENFINMLYDIRQEGVQEEGEFSLKNLLFKEFRNLGYLDDMKELRRELKGKELSLENLNEDVNYNELLKDAYRELDKANIHFNVDKTKFEFNTAEDARTAYSILMKLYGNDNVTLDGEFNVNVYLNESLNEDADEDDELTIDNVKKWLSSNGATISNKTRKAVVYKDGYEISLDGSEEKFEDIDLDSEEDVKKIYEAIIRKVEEGKYPYTGIWMEGKTVYVDYSEHFEGTEEEAIKKGFEQKQLTIFNWAYTSDDDKYISTGYVKEENTDLKKEESCDTINEEVKDMHKLILDNCKKQTWFEYYLKYVCSSEQEVRDDYGDEEELDGIANYYADVLDNGKKICTLNYANFDGMGTWAELGVNDIQSDDLLKALDSLGYEADCNDVECELGHPKSLEFKENSECEEVFAPFVKDIEDAMNGKKEESLKEEDKSELYKLVQELRNYLWDTEKVSYEIWDDPQDNSINADIEWGDWKHDHLWFDRIAEKWLNEKGYEVVSFNTDVTEEDGSDTYSALHTLKIAKKQ